jgi:pimeloyl-ACP methyl ester carboxylesterase
MDVTVDGKRAHAATGGREAGADEPAVILIHGAGTDRTLWQLQTRNIAHGGRRVFALDMPGHGHSAGPALTTIADMAGWVTRFMDAAGIKCASVIGYSMGSLVALELAASHPDRVERVVLMGIADEMPVHPDLLAAAEANQALGPELIVFWGLGAHARIGGHPHPGLWVSGVTETLLKHSKAGVLFADLASCDVYEGAYAAAAKVKCPVRLVLGAEDSMAPAKKGLKLGEAMTGAEVSSVVIPGAGHMMMLEQPDAVYHALKGFVF